MRSDRPCFLVPTSLLLRVGSGVCLGIAIVSPCSAFAPAALTLTARGGGPAITMQPIISQIISDGTGATISCAASGTGLSYQWRLNGTPISNNANYAGATAAILTISNSNLTLAGKYTCVVSNTGGSATTNFSYLAVRAPAWNQFPTNAPPPNGASPIAFDLLRNVAVVWTSNCTATPLNGTWELLGTTWTTITIPGRPATCARGYLAYDNVRHTTVQFGGTGSDDRAYEYDGGSWGRSAVPGPAPRFGHRMVGVSERNAIFMFGGRRISDNLLTNEAYEYTGAAWNPVTAPGPSARQDFAMTFDPVTHKVVVFGGTDAAGRMGDTWEFDVVTQTWAQFSPPTAPTARAAATMAFMPEVGAVFLFGGFDGTVFMNDTWRYDCATHTWRPVIGIVTPPQAQGYMVYDNAVFRLLMIQATQTWELRNYAVGCPADYNNNNIVNSQDLFEFLNAFFMSNADFNGDGFTNSQDFFDYLAVFFTQC